MATKKPKARYIAFLRGINVGGHRVKMDHLRELFEALKFANVSTFIASGNVIFDASSTDAAALEKQIELHLKDALGYEAHTFIRTPSELAAVAEHRPFADADMDAAGYSIHVAFLRDAFGKETQKKLLAMRTSFDEFHVHGREFYWLCRGRFSDSLVPGPLLAKTISVSVTMRNVKTIRKLAAKCPVE